jgi:DNA invertase Pin-like site-specific DNA recombinase
MAICGYARTSTQEQIAGLEAQVRDLKQVGAVTIYSEQASSLGDRPVLDQCLERLTDGDVLVVTKPDRLARSTAHLLSIVDDLNARKVGLIILSMNGERLDTRSPTSKLILTIMAAVAEFETSIMKERQKEGIDKAKSEGKYKGRLPKIDYAEVRRLYPEIGAVATAKQLGTTKMSVYRILAKVP